MSETNNETSENVANVETDANSANSANSASVEEKAKNEGEKAAKLFSIGLQCSFCELKPSPFSPKGIGVFARRPIPAQTILRFPRPQSIGMPLSMLQSLPEEFQAWIQHNCWITTDDDMTVPIRGMHDLSMETYFTHRKKPNARYDHETSTYVATCDIQPDEEVTINYDQRRLHAKHLREPLQVSKNRKKVKKRHLHY